MSPSELGPAFDLLAAYEPGRGVFVENAGIGVVIGGTTREVSAAEVGAALGGDEVAAGALPFLPDDRAPLLVGDDTVTRLVGAITLRTSAAEREFARVVGRTAPFPPFAAMQLRPVPDEAAYAKSVATAARRVTRHELDKVVLARTIEVQADRRLDEVQLAHRLRAVNPDATVFIAPTPAGTLVGATPELLVSRRGAVVRANPLAGSAPRSADRDEDRDNAERLGSSNKDRVEHSVVVEAIAEVLGPFCDDLTWDPEPVVLATPNVWHLSTRFVGRLRQQPPDVLTLVRALHPTPAVCGTPRAAALETIAAAEPFDRGAYAGPVGWVDASGDGEWSIALRCALLDGDRATLFAGAGIVAGSEPAAELDETERKFSAFLDALRWG